MEEAEKDPSSHLAKEEEVQAKAEEKPIIETKAELQLPSHKIQEDAMRELGELLKKEDVRVSLIVDLSQKNSPFFVKKEIFGRIEYEDEKERYRKI